MMINTVIFDVGGVLIRTEDPTPRRQLEARLGLSPGQSEQLVFNSQAGRQAQLGQISAAQLWQWIGQELALDDAGVARFRHEFFGGDRLNTALMEYIHRLRPHFRLAIISNFMDDLRLTLTERYPIAEAFELVVGSAYEGVMKPNAEIYRRTLARLEREPPESVFIDDFMRNVEGARAVGMQAIHYTPATDVPAELARLGVTIKPAHKPGG